MKVFTIFATFFLMMGCASKGTLTSDNTQAMDATKKAANESKVKKAMEEESKESGAQQAVPATTDGQKAECTLGSETRSLFLSNMSEGGCEVIYTKDGESKQVASAKYDASYCDKVFEKLNQICKQVVGLCE